MNLYRRFDTNEETPVQFVGVYATRWRPACGEPSVMFREVQEDEALAFARQLPEVRALAEDLREATLICQGQLALNRHIGNVTVTEEWEQRIGRYKLHLAPFEEVPDATE